MLMWYVHVRVLTRPVFLCCPMRPCHCHLGCVKKRPQDAGFSPKGAKPLLCWGPKVTLCCVKLPADTSKYQQWFQSFAEIVWYNIQ